MNKTEKKNTGSPFLLIAQLIEAENTIFTYKVFIDFLDGHLIAASMLSKLWYWTPKSKMNGWVAKSFDDWYEEIRATKRQISLARKKLVAKGVIEYKVKKFNGFPTGHYKIRQKELMEALVTKCHYGKLHNVTNDSNKMSLSLDSDKMSLSITHNQLIQTINTNTIGESEKINSSFESPNEPLQVEPKSSISIQEITSLANDLSKLWGYTRAGRPVIDELKKQISIHPNAYSEIREHAPKFIASRDQKYWGRLLGYLEEEKYLEPIIKRNGTQKPDMKTVPVNPLLKGK